ncbi:hypothetical protein KSF59_15925, partial [Vibrio parahaemolyticus]|uniref:hypothetical protein n=1 Tax=Vibrio parahaemolyticus TaxID=670 RepID=UPI001F23C7CA
LGGLVSRLNYATKPVEIAISLIKEALPKDFEQQESYKILSERLQNFIKAIWKHGKQDAED